MKVQTMSNHFVRCERPGCMAGYVGWNEPCEQCNGTGWITIPEVKTSGNVKAFFGYVGFVVVTAVCMYLLFR